MPRLKSSAPRSDMLKAMMLQHKKELGMGMEELAAKMKVSRSKMSEMLNKKSTDEWTLGEIKRACSVLWITADDMRNAIKM